jgi:chromosome condensin MukBEF ATPase and DNA-binding subunit MukB
VFASSSELERKRKAEQSIANQISALREMVLQLIKGQEAQREQAEAERVSQKQEVEELKAIIQSLRQETERQSRATTVLEGLSEKSAGTLTYSQVAQAGLQQATKSQKKAVPSNQKGRSSTGLARTDERTVHIDTGRTKAEKTDFAVVKERL